MSVTNITEFRYIDTDTGIYKTIEVNNKNISYHEYNNSNTPIVVKFSISMKYKKIKQVMELLRYSFNYVSFNNHYAAQMVYYEYKNNKVLFKLRLIQL